MSNAAAAFFLEKSNKMLLLFKALKRRPNTNTETSMQNDTLISSMSRSKQTSAVNCMDLDVNLPIVGVLQSNSNNNIYAEINLHDDTSTKQLTTFSKSIDSNNCLPSVPTERLFFNDIKSLSDTCGHEQSVLKCDEAYVNEHLTSNLSTQMIVNAKHTNDQNVYEIGEEQIDPKQLELAGMSTNVAQPSVNSNYVISKAFENKQNRLINYDGDSSSKSAIESGPAMNINTKPSFRKRLKFTFMTGFQFSKDLKVCCLTASLKVILTSKEIAFSFST